MAKRHRPPHSKKSQKASRSNQGQFDQLLQGIAQQIDAGELAPAETSLRQILQQQPRNGFALYLLGVLAHRTNHIEQAVGLIEQAIKSRPKVALFHISITEMYRQLGRLYEALVHGRKAIKIEPSNAEAHSNLGIVYYSRKEYDQAVECQQRALKLDPNLVPAINNLGCIHGECGEKEKAIGYFRQVLELDPGYLGARNNLGAALTELERPKEAIVELNAVIQANPGYASAYANLGAALLLLEQSEQAEAAYRKNLELLPDNVVGKMGLVRALKKQERLSEAQTIIEQLVAVEPSMAEAYSLLGEIYLLREYYAEAETAFNKTIELEPGLPGAYLGLGQVQTEQGLLDAACANFAHVIDIDPNNILPHIYLSNIRKLSNRDPSLLRMEAAMEHVDDLVIEKVLPMRFALGKTYDGLQEYDKAFHHFVEGCRIQRALVTYDADEFDKVCASIKSYFSREKIDHLRGAGDPSDVPIFILGMPRSGTTLVETIISNHPDVYAAGELSDLHSIASQPNLDAEPSKYPSSLNKLTQDDLSAMGARYVDGLRSRENSARHITDKNMFTFMAIGLIHLILPNAKIIHVKRNPLDTCLSIFTQLFNGNAQAYSYDLTEIGGYYINYARLMEHWHSVLPDNAFYEMQYEELVTDNEVQVRRLIDYCGLEWDDACMESHKSSRSVKTASITQVRQPVYTSSVGRWRNYEKHLQPLINALGPYASD
jgi:tetratricopeptide (TPR) repeat protein